MKIDTAVKLIEHIEAKYQVMVHDICCLEKSCKRNKRCSASNGIPMIDFDKVKDIRCKGSDPLPSVDGLLEQGGVLCFVEHKSWKNYLKYQSPESELDIQQQLIDYNLEGKLIQSMLMCKDEANNDALFSKFPVLFVLATDIDVNKSGDNSFWYNLTVLSHSASDWENVCNRQTNDALKQLNVNTLYCSCQNFDEEFMNGVMFFT